jgi:hypothetical protein
MSNEYQRNWRAHPELHACDCGNPAVKTVGGAFVCERCSKLHVKQEVAGKIRKMSQSTVGLMRLYREDEPEGPICGSTLVELERRLARL